MMKRHQIVEGDRRKELPTVPLVFTPMQYELRAFYNFLKYNKILERNI